MTRRRTAAAAAALIGFCIFTCLQPDDRLPSVSHPPPPPSSTETRPYQRQRSLLPWPGSKNPYINPLIERNVKPLTSEPNPAEETVTFWHIPRSGGTTLEDIYKCMEQTLAVRAWAEPQSGHDEDEEIILFAPRNAYTPTHVNIKSLNRLHAEKPDLVPPSGKVDLIVMSGSLNFASEHLYDKSRKGRVLGLFRHPVERLISQFYYRQIATWDPSYRPDWKDMDVAHWAENVNDESNSLVKALAGLDHDADVITEEHLSMAIRTVGYRFVIGLTDQMEESVHRFNIFMGINESEESKRECMNQYFGHGIKRDNSNPHPMIEKGSPAWRALAQRNKFDIRLYMAIVEQFYEQNQIIASYAMAAWEWEDEVASDMSKAIEEMDEDAEEEETEGDGPLFDEFNNQLNGYLSAEQPTAVIHIGPPVTGSISLQISLKQSDVITALMEDGYSMPWFMLGKETSSESVLAACFLTEKKKAARMANDKNELCPEEELSVLKKLGDEGKSVFLSAETFTASDPGQLANFFESYWRVTIVYLHRWFHDWVFSMYEQTEKSDLWFQHGSFEKFMAANGSGDVHHVRFLEWFEKIYKYDFEWGAYQTFYRFKEHFDHVVALDYDDKHASIQKKVFCDGVPNARRTCKHFSTQTEEAKNPGEPSVYRMIAYDASMLGVITYCSAENFRHVAHLIRNYHENTLGLSQFDFPMKCLEEAMLERLIDLSVEHRRNILTTVPLSKADEIEIRTEYWTKVKQRSCHADTNAILEMPEWLEFFDALNKDGQCP